jgi:hypothetical protein
VGVMVMAGVVGVVVRHGKMLHYNITGVHVVATCRMGRAAAKPIKAGARDDGFRFRSTHPTTDATSHSRGAFPPEACFDFTLLKDRGRREDRVHAAPAVSRAICAKKMHTSIQVQRRHPAFPAQWLYGLLRALPGERLFCHRRPQEACFSRT